MNCLAPKRDCQQSQTTTLDVESDADDLYAAAGALERSSGCKLTDKALKTTTTTTETCRKRFHPLRMDFSGLCGRFAGFTRLDGLHNDQLEIDGSNVLEHVS